MVRARPTLLLLGGLAAALAVGCKEDQIERYQVDRVDSPKTHRTLGAIVPREGGAWFFKVQDTVEAVKPHEAAFERFLSTVRFTDDRDKPVTWTLPEGWKEEPGERQFRHATIRLGSGPAAPELSVSQATGSVIDNVNRWRRQLGLRPMLKAELDSVSRPVRVDGIDSLLVDLVGAVEQSALPAAAPGRRLTYDLPTGWKELPNAPFSVATFQVDEADPKTVLTVSPLTGAGGGLLQNVNRWREQVGLPPVAEDGLREGLKDVTVGGLPGHVVDLAGPASGAGPRERILGAIVPQGGRTWFIKLRGPAEVVEKQRANFEAFIKSLQLDGV